MKKFIDSRTILPSLSNKKHKDIDFNLYRIKSSSTFSSESTCANLSKYGDIELSNLIEKLNSDIEFLKKENKLFEKYLLENVIDENDDEDNRSRRRRGSNSIQNLSLYTQDISFNEEMKYKNSFPKRHSITSRPSLAEHYSVTSAFEYDWFRRQNSRLTLNQKFFIVANEISKLNESMTRKRYTNQLEIDNIMELLELNDFLIKYYKACQYRFKMKLQKFYKYSDDNLKANFVMKLFNENLMRLNDTLNMQISNKYILKKALKTLKGKERISDSFGEHNCTKLDYEMLKAESSLIHKKLDERSNETIRLSKLLFELDKKVKFFKKELGMYVKI